MVAVVSSAVPYHRAPTCSIHHLPPDAALPPAVAVVHPRLPGGRYPFGELCGAGVAFKLAWGLAVHWCGSQRLPKPIQQAMLDMLPLAALGTIADVVPLVDENRILASFGLQLIKKTPLDGLRALDAPVRRRGQHCQIGRPAGAAANKGPD